MPKSRLKDIQDRYGRLGIFLAVVGLIVAIVFPIVELKSRYDRFAVQLNDVENLVKATAVPTGKIVTPPWGGNPPIERPGLNATGTVMYIKPDDYIWLFVIEEGKDLIWPQGKITSSEWMLEIGLGDNTKGAGQWYWIALGIVNQNVDKELSIWLEACNREKRCPGKDKNFQIERWLDFVHVKRM